MAFIVNSSPGAGLRFEPSLTVADVDAALSHAAVLGLRGMRMIRIINTDTGEVFEEKTLRQQLLGAAKG